MQDEYFKEIIDFPDYIISNLCRVISFKANKPRILKSFINKSNGYSAIRLYENGKGKSFYIHRLIAQHFLEDFDCNLCVDHIDRNKINNDISNLRMVTFSINNRNVGASKNNKSGYRGVFFDKVTKKWKVSIKVGDKRAYIGRYMSKDRAVEARREAELEYWGEIYN